MFDAVIGYLSAYRVGRPRQSDLAAVWQNPEASVTTSGKTTSLPLPDLAAELLVRPGQPR